MLTFNWLDFDSNVMKKDEIAAMFVLEFQKKKLIRDWTILGPIEDWNEGNVTFFISCLSKSAMVDKAIDINDYLYNKDIIQAFIKDIAEDISGCEVCWNIDEGMRMSKEAWDDMMSKVSDEVQFDGNSALMTFDVAKKVLKGERADKKKIVIA